MHYESECICTSGLCKCWLNPKSVFFSNSALGDEASSKHSGKLFLFDPEKGGRQLHSWFVLWISNSLLIHRIANHCYLAFSSTCPGKWLHKMTVYLLTVFPFFIPQIPSQQPLWVMIILWFCELRKTDPVKIIGSDLISLICLMNAHVYADPLSWAPVLYMISPLSCFWQKG